MQERRATVKQLELIECMGEIVKEKFTGETLEEAKAYISRNMSKYKLYCQQEWAIVNGYD